MAHLAKLIRHTPGTELKAYFVSRNIDFIEPVDWAAPRTQLVGQVLAGVDQLDEVTRNRLILDAEYIDGMTTEVGQAAIMSVFDPATRAVLADMESHHARALWVYTRHHNKFIQAGDVCFFEHARTRRTWDGYSTSPGQTVRRDVQSLNELAKEIRQLFAEGKVCKAEVFDRERIVDDGTAIPLVHVSVHWESMPDSKLIFRNHDLDILVFRPAREVAFNYDPRSGALDVIAPTKSIRAKLVEMFVRHLLGGKHAATPIPIRTINFDRFLDPREFTWDAEDGISSIVVKQLKVLPINRPVFVTFEPKDASDTALAALRAYLGGRTPSAANCKVYEVVLVVQFKPDWVNPRGKMLSVRLVNPNGCDLTEKTAKERLLLNKYLARWEIFQAIAS